MKKHTSIGKKQSKLELLERVTVLLLQQKGTPASARWISRNLSEDQKKVSRQLKKLANAGIAKSELRIEFDAGYSYKFGVLSLKRRRLYFWIDLNAKKNEI